MSAVWGVSLQQDRSNRAGKCVIDVEKKKGKPESFFPWLLSVPSLRRANTSLVPSLQLVGWFPAPLEPL